MSSRGSRAASPRLGSSSCRQEQGSSVCRVWVAEPGLIAWRDGPSRLRTWGWPCLVRGACSGGGGGGGGGHHENYSSHPTAYGVVRDMRCARPVPWPRPVPVRQTSTSAALHRQRAGAPLAGWVVQERRPEHEGRYQGVRER